MAECKGHTGDYFNYTCYHRLREYYYKIPKTETCINFLKQYKVPLVDKTIAESSYKPLIDELVNSLSSNGLNYHIDNSITCKYINYWLQEEIKENYSMLFGFKFDIFKECADEYTKFKNGRTVYKENSCGPYINSIPDDKYSKMNSLYKLYLWHKQLVQPNRVNTNFDLCGTLKLMAFHYRQMINEFKEDRDLCSKLNEFKKLVMNNKTFFQDACEIDISDNMPTPTMFLPKVETPERVKENIALQNTMSTPQGNELQHSVDESRETSGSRLTDGPVSHPGPSPVVGSQTNEFPEAVSGTEQLAAAGSPREQAYTLKPQETAFDSTALPYSVYPEVGSELKMERGVPRDPENNIFEERNNNIHGNMISLDTGGFSGAIKDTFSNIVQNVQPGPVLGVSGGMGVLFLLFKYTPVGSFFGGRRGRNHRIPGSFAGHVPAEFPAFQEDGGYIGYSPMNMPFQAE
ncbi:VIR protein [Plasmodium vivax]|uniref:VIR protein n=1 Tax=Plasmodium vivax TaxID=5855 RepID=A0A1G4E5Q6_PLAVI|nr:VIR protein [Plasmodium vivax]